MKKLSVTQYANSTGVTRQAVLSRIKRKRLPDGVTAHKIGKTYVINCNNVSKINLPKNCNIAK